MSDNTNKLQNSLMDIKLWDALGVSLACTQGRLAAPLYCLKNQYVFTKFTTHNAMKVKVMVFWVPHFLFSYQPRKQEEGSVHQK